MGVKVADDVLKEVEQEIEGGFVTDHYGVMGDFELVGGWSLRTRVMLVAKARLREF